MMSGNYLAVSTEITVHAVLQFPPSIVDFERVLGSMYSTTVPSLKWYDKVLV